MEERVVTAFAAAVQITSGPIPRAADLYEYTTEHQERILRMSEAPTTDESRRRDEVTQARIAQSKSAQWLTPAMLFACVACALVTFGWFRNTIGGVAFLALPVFKFLGAYAVTFSMSGKRRAP